MATDDQIILARTHLASARHVTVLTGAGISADSGVPTFRGADGLWRNFRAEDLATGLGMVQLAARIDRYETAEFRPHRPCRT